MKKKVKIFAVIIIVILVALIAVYNFGTSQYCIKKIILPIVAEKTNSKISVADIDVSLMGSSVMINDLNYSSSEMSMQSEKLIIKTSFYDILFNNKINIKKLLLKNTSLNLDISPKKNVIIAKDKLEQKKIVAAEKKSADKSSIYKISLNDINLENLNVLVKNNETTTKISKLNLSIPNIEPGKECSINLNGGISLSDGKKLAEGIISSKSSITINNNFIPTHINSVSLIKLDKNKMPLIIKLDTKKDGAFDFSLKLSDILIKPFVSAFVTGPYSNTKGEINNISLKATGKDINDLVLGSNPINSSATISGIDISSENNFYLKNKSIRTSFDLLSIIKGNFLPDKIKIQDLNTEYTNSDQLVKIDGLNLNVNKKNENEIKAIINTGFGYNKGSKQLKGSIAGNLQLSGKDIFKPDNVNSNIDLKLNGHNMPIVVKYENNSDTEKALINIKNFDIDSIKDFLNDSSKLTGGVSDLNITLSGKGIDALKKGFQKDSDSSIISDLSVKNINIKNNGEYSAKVPYLNINLDLNKILNKKYYINSFTVDNPNIAIVKKTVPKKVNNTKASVNASPTTNKPVAVSTKTTPKYKHYDFDIKDLNINNLRAEIISDKNLVFSNVNIKSKQIKANTPSSADLSLNYTIDNKLKGSFKTQNDFIITSVLLPKTFNSKIEMINGKSISQSNLNFTCKRASHKNISFRLKTDIKGLLLDPLLMTFVSPPYNMTKTNINTLALNIKGQDLYNFKTMDGIVTSELTNVSIPINVGNKNIVETMFYPLQVIANLASNTALKFVSGNIGKSIAKIDYMFNHKKRIDFKNGKLNIVLTKGIVDIKMFDFFGIPQSPVSEMKAEGRINLNNDVIGLNTNTVFAGIIIPLDITGTIQKPETDTTKMTAQILQQNADTFLNTGFDTTNTVIDTIDKIKHNKFIDLLQTPVPNDKSTQGAETTPASQQQNTVGDAVTNVLNILGHNTNASSPENTQKQNSNNNKKEPIKLDETIKNLLNF